MMRMNKQKKKKHFIFLAYLKKIKHPALTTAIDINKDYPTVIIFAGNCIYNRITYIKHI